MTLTISDYKPKRVKMPGGGVSTGQMAQFHLPPNSEGVVLQYVEHVSRFSTGGDTEVRRSFFTEGWEVRKNGGITPDGGRDYFLVPNQYHAAAGSVKIKAYSWFVPAEGKETPKSMMGRFGLTKGGSPISGILLSKTGKRRVSDIKHRRIVRTWDVSWIAADNLKKWRPKYKHQTKHIAK